VALITAQPLGGTHAALLGDLQRARGRVTDLRVLCTVSEEAHAGLTANPLGPDAYTEYTDVLRGALSDARRAAGAEGRGEGGAGDGEGELRVSVEHLPMQVCALGARTFVLPRGGAADAAGVAPPGGGSDGTLGGLLPAAGAEGYSLGDEARVPDGVTLHAHALFDLARQLDVRFRLFAVGPAARATARLLARLQAAPRLGLLSQTLREGAALVVVDRTLDLVSPNLHGDSLVDAALVKLRPAAPPDPDFCPLDAGIPTDQGGGGGAGSEGCSKPGGVELPAGSLGECPQDGPEGALLEALVESRTKKAALALRKSLKEVVAARKLAAPKTKGRLGTVSAAEVGALGDTLSGDGELQHRHLLRLARLGAAALDREAAAQWSAAAKAEKMGMVSAADGLAGVKAHLLEALGELREALAGEQRGEGCDGGGRGGDGSPAALAALGQVLAGFSLAGDFPLADCEDALWGGDDSELVQALAAVTALRPGLSLGALRDLFRTLVLARAEQQGLRHLLPRTGGVEGASYCPLLRQALLLALSGQDHTQDVVPVSSTVGGLLKSGLKGLGFEQRGVIGSDTVVLFVVGGITLAEAAEVREAFADLHGGAASGVELVIGGTRLLQPDSLARALLSSAPL